MGLPGCNTVWRAEFICPPFSSSELLVHPPLCNNLIARRGGRSRAHHPKVQDVSHVILDNDRHGLVTRDTNDKRAVFNVHVDRVPDHLMTAFLRVGLTSLVVQTL